MNQEVTIWYVGPLEGVGVGDTNDANGLRVWRWKSGRTTKTEEDLVEWVDEGNERRGYQVVWEWTAVIRVGHGVGGGGEGESSRE